MAVQEEAKQQAESPGKNDLNDSFEDLSEDYINKIIQEDITKDAKGDVKVLINPDSRIVFDDYISGGGSPQEEKNSEEESKNGSHKQAEDIDWFRLYVEKKYGFRDDKKLYDKVRNAIMINRQISPKQQFYDDIKVEVNLPKKGKKKRSKPQPVA